MTNEEARKEIQRWLDGCPWADTKEAFELAIMALKNERPKGEWINKHFEHADCSICGRRNAYHGDFCKFCGADMRKGGAE